MGEYLPGQQPNTRTRSMERRLQRRQGVETASAPMGTGGRYTATAQPALTPVHTGPIDATYGAEEAAILANLRTRQLELESRLQALGLIE